MGVGLVRSLQLPDILWIHLRVYNSIANTKQGGTLSIPFWYLCQKFSLSLLYFNKSLLHTHTQRRYGPYIQWNIQFSSVVQSCPTLCDPMNCSTPGLPVHHQHPDFTQTHIHQVGNAIQPSHPLLSPFPLDPNPSQHQRLFQWVNSSHEVAKVLEFQL